jgi:hypothetical protein
MEFMCGGSTYRDQRDNLAPLVPHRAQGSRIECWPAVNQEVILMMAVVKRETEDPAAVRHPEHRIGERTPMIEITENVGPHESHDPTNLRPQNPRAEWLAIGSARFAVLRTIMENARFCHGVAILTPRTGRCIIKIRYQNMHHQI